MDPPLTPTPALGGAQPLRSPPSSASPRKRPQHNDYPLSTDNRSGNGPMGRSDQEPASATSNRAHSQVPATNCGSAKPKNKRRNRRRKPHNRKQSFLAPTQETSHERPGTSAETGGAGKGMENDRLTSKDNPSFFKLGRNLSNTSIESDALLDHRYVFWFAFGIFSIKVLRTF